MLLSLCDLLELWLNDSGFALSIQHQSGRCTIGVWDSARNWRYIGHIETDKIVLYDDVDWAAEREVSVYDAKFFELLEEHLSFAKS